MRSGPSAFEKPRVNADFGFGVYGTLLDPLAVRGALAELDGEQLAERVAILRRSGQPGIAFRSATWLIWDIARANNDGIRAA